MASLVPSPPLNAIDPIVSQSDLLAFSIRDGYTILVHAPVMGGDALASRGVIESLLVGTCLKPPDLPCVRLPWPDPHLVVSSPSTPVAPPDPPDLPDARDLRLQPSRDLSSRTVSTFRRWTPKLQEDPFGEALSFVVNTPVTSSDEFGLLSQEGLVHYNGVLGYWIPKPLPKVLLLTCSTFAPNVNMPWKVVRNLDGPDSGSPKSLALVYRSQSHSLVSFPPFGNAFLDLLDVISLEDLSHVLNLVAKELINLSRRAKTVATYTNLVSKFVC
ncbi:hypothetical protein AALP_AA7G018500 [Arabis alpina]|uniref:Uncharacterized protein n=1 Tax=Arabis alpina TaxID=50452 RepID=A0A087GFE7_ARAAL|nr:hypothetical protein AALP_AA7G018500 [Arabis alpina]